MQTSSSFRSGLLLASSLLAISSAPAIALAAAASDNAEELAPVVVSAQKRDQNQIDVPITIQAFSGDYVAKAGIQNLTDLSTLTPGFYVQNQSSQNPGLVMRGITDDDAGPTDEARVSVYQDGVSISRITTASTELFDIQRIEVEKGPQSTLFGRSALTGAVNIIQNKANERGLDWNAKVEGGNYNYKDVEGMVNLPLTDHFALRVAGRYKDRDGYITNVLDPSNGGKLNGSNATAYRIALNYSDSRYTNDLLFNAESNVTGGVAYKNLDFYPTDPTTGAILGDLNAYSAVALNTDQTLAGTGHLSTHRRLIGVTDIATANLGGGYKLTATTAWRHDHFNELGDNDGTAVAMINSNTFGGGHQYSEELRINYDNGGPFTAFGGVSYFQEGTQGTTQVDFGQPGLLALLTGVLDRTNHAVLPSSVLGSTQVLSSEVAGLLGLPQAAAGLPLVQGLAANLTGAHASHQEQATTVARDRSFDVFADATFKATDKLELSAGIRYTRDNKSTLFSSQVADRSVLGGLIGLASIPAAYRTAILSGLANPYGTSLTAIPASVLPAFGLIGQPTENNGQYDKASLTDSGLSWRFTGRYALDEKHSLYATYSRGRRPQVLSGTAGSSPFAAAKFTPEAAETLDNYEAGYKAQSADRTLSVDAAVYYNEYHHFSTTVVQGSQYVTIDAGEAQTYGFESQAIWTPTRDIDLFGAFGYTHGRYASGLYRNNRFRLTPDYTLSLGGAYRLHLLGGTFEVLPRYQWKSKYYFNADNGISSEQNYILKPIRSDQSQEAFGVLDLRVGYSMTGQPWKIEAFATNLNNQKFLKDAGNTGSDIGLPTYIPGEPRFYGLSFSIRK